MARRAQNRISYPVEHRVAQKQKRRRMQDIVLLGIAAATVAGVAITAPSALLSLGYVGKIVGPHEHIDRRIYQALARLRKKGLLTPKNLLTKAGKTRAATLVAVEKVAPKVRLRWDRKWRIIMFDIWEKRREVRDRMRGVLERMGFVKLQESVWVYPYPCEELFIYLRTELRLGPGVRYLVVDEIDNDDELRLEFGLPLR